MVVSDDPNVQWLAVQRVAIRGAPVTISPLVTDPAGASWGAGDTIVFAMNNTSGLCGFGQR